MGSGRACAPLPLGWRAAKVTAMPSRINAEPEVYAAVRSTTAKLCGSRTPQPNRPLRARDRLRGAKGAALYRVRVDVRQDRARAMVLAGVDSTPRNRPVMEDASR